MTIPATLRNMAILPLTLAPSQSLGATCLDDMAKQTAISPKREKGRFIYLAMHFENIKTSTQLVLLILMVLITKIMY